MEDLTWRNVTSLISVSLSEETSADDDGTASINPSIDSMSISTIISLLSNDVSVISGGDKGCVEDDELTKLNNDEEDEDEAEIWLNATNDIRAIVDQYEGAPAYEVDLNFLKQRLTADDAQHLLTLALAMSCTAEKSQHAHGVDSDVTDVETVEIFGQTFTKLDVERLLTLATMATAGYEDDLSSLSMASLQHESRDDSHNSPKDRYNAATNSAGTEMRDSIEVAHCSGVPIILTDSEYQLVENALIASCSSSSSDTDSVDDAQGDAEDDKGCKYDDKISTIDEEEKQSALTRTSEDANKIEGKNDNSASCPEFVGLEELRDDLCNHGPWSQGYLHHLLVAVFSPTKRIEESRMSHEYDIMETDIIFERIDTRGSKHCASVSIGRGNELTLATSTLRDAMVEARLLNKAIFRSKTRSLLMDVKYGNDEGKCQPMICITSDTAKSCKLSDVMPKIENKQSPMLGHKHVILIQLKDAPETCMDEYDVDF